MALTPQTDAAFLREVDEQVRLDSATRFWKRWGLIVVALVVAALLALGGWLWWSHQRDAAAGVEGEQMTLALEDLAANNRAKAEPVLKTLTNSKTPGYRAAAKLALADIALAAGDKTRAATAFGAVAADTTLAQSYRDLATIRQVSAAYDTLKPEEAIARLKPLAVAGKPWFGSAGEMTAIAYLRLNRPREAGAMFAALAKDQGVPQSIRSRSIQLAGVLGVDAAPADKGNNR